MNFEGMQKGRLADQIAADRKFGVGLLAGFLVLVSIVIGVGSMGVNTMKRLHRDAQVIADSQWTDVQLATKALAYSNENNGMIVQLALADNRNETKSVLARRAENSTKISALLQQLRTRVGSKKEQDALSSVESARAAYLTSYEQAVRLLLGEKDANQARKWINQDTLPRLQSYHDAWQAYTEFQTEELNEHLAESAVRYSAARRRTIWLVSLSVLFALAIGIAVFHRSMAEIYQREGAEAHIRQLNEELELKVRQRTAAFEKSNRDLLAEIAERKQIEEMLRSESAFLEAQTNSTLDGILVVDNNNRMILKNQRFAEMFQIPEQLFETENHSAVLEYATTIVEDPDGFLRQVNYLNDHQSEISRDEIELKDGMTVDRYSAPVMDKDGKYYGRIWTFQDITERKQRENVVRRLSMAVEQSPICVVMTDLCGRITYVNRKFVECTGYAFEEVIGKNPKILKSGHTGKEEYKKLWQAITTGNEWRGQFHNRKKNGELYWESAVIRPIQDEKGTTTHFLALKEDITEQRKLQVQLQHAQKLEGVGLLASGIAHEINTPTQYIGDNVRFLTDAFRDLTGLMAGYERLRTAAEGNRIADEITKELSAAATNVDICYLLEEIPKALAQTMEGVGRVSKLVIAMKEFSHPGTKEKTPTDLNRAIENTLTISRNEWKYVAEVETNLDSSLPLIACLPGEFNQVVLNLIVNAAHAIGEVVEKGSSTKGKIRVQTINCDGWAEIRIGDSGQGIPQTIQSHIFEPFFTTKEVGKGTGQGLTIARSVIVDKHGGTIHFETQLGKGTTFIVRMPKDGNRLSDGAGEIQDETHFICR